MVNFYNKTKKGGFTLMELIVVIAIIALLSVIVLVSLGDAKDKARNSQAQQESRSLQNALELYRAEKGVYPLDAPWPNNQYYRLGAPSEWVLYTTAMQPYLDINKLKSMVYPGPGNVSGSSNLHYMPPNSAQFYGSGYFDWRCGNPANGIPEQPVRGKYLVMFYSAVPLTLDQLYMDPYAGNMVGFQPGYYCFTAK
jgi:prepilin-type N-terminal cleavage/methylation domain-containing protein